AALEPAADRACSDQRCGDGRRRAPRQVLREDWRAARHGAQPRVSATGDDGDGAANLFRCRSKKTEVIQAIKPLDRAQVFKDVVRGQYDAGRVLGKQVRAYRQEPDVAPNSTTETYIACKLNIDNWRWAGVPFYLRTGKYMKRRS